MVKPNILDPNWKYTKAVATDIRKTFARIRREMEQKKEQKPNVTELRKAK